MIRDGFRFPQADDLNAPLGRQARPSPGRRLPVTPSQAVAGALGLFAIVFVVWTMTVTDPLGGEPMATAAIPQPNDGSSLAAASPAGSDVTGTIPAIAAVPLRTEQTSPEIPAGSRSITIINGSNGQRQEVVVPGNTASAARGSEASRGGPAVRPRKQPSP